MAVFRHSQAIFSVYITLSSIFTLKSLIFNNFIYFQQNYFNSSLSQKNIQNQSKIKRFFNYFKNRLTSSAVKAC